MNKPGIIVELNCKDGKRDEVKALWERMVKPHAAENPEVLVSLYNYGAANSNQIILVEFFQGQGVLESAFGEEWFQQYMKEMGELLQEEPKVTSLLNIWAKDS